MPLINLQASPVWKQLFSVLSRMICRFLKQAREHDGTGASLQRPAVQVLPKEPHFASPPRAQDSALPSPSAHFGMSLTPALSLQGTQPSCWDEAVSTPWVPSSHLSDKLSLEAAGWCQPSPYPAAGVK